jgi:hypothetical protein
MNLRINHALAVGALCWLPISAQAAEWTEVLVTTGDVNAVAMENGRQVMTYYATGGIALIANDKMAPGGSFECAGMIDAGPDGMKLSLSCATTDTDGDRVFSEVTRGKDSDMPTGQGVYAYTGGTGKWSVFTADYTYEVHTQPGMKCTHSRAARAWSLATALATPCHRRSRTETALPSFGMSRYHRFRHSGERDGD